MSRFSSGTSSGSGSGVLERLRPRCFFFLLAVARLPSVVVGELSLKAVRFRLRDPSAAVAELGGGGGAGSGLLTSLGDAMKV